MKKKRRFSTKYAPIFQTYDEEIYKKYGCVSPLMTNKDDSSLMCDIGGFDNAKKEEFYYDDKITKNLAKSTSCPTPCGTIGLNFGIPIISKIDIDPDEAYLNFYFKNQINVRSSVSSYSMSSLVADIGCFWGLLLGFPILEMIMIIKKSSYWSHFCSTKRPYSIKPTQLNLEIKKEHNENIENTNDPDGKDLGPIFAGMIDNLPLVNHAMSFENKSILS